MGTVFTVQAFTLATIHSTTITIRTCYRRTLFTPQHHIILLKVKKYSSDKIQNPLY
jgi:hypothetical protein